MTVYRLCDTGIDFPDPGKAEPNGLLAIGGDLSPRRLVAAYLSGIFPWYDKCSPRLWWSPDPRCILLPEEFHMPRSLSRVVRKGCFTCTFDRAFTEVINGCAIPRGDSEGAWLLDDMVDAYTILYRMGLVHSVEAWHEGELAGGLYGLALGGVFFGESMFFRKSDASKAAFVHLVKELTRAGFALIDCQQQTANMARFGARLVPREEFMARLDAALELRQGPGWLGSWKDGVPL